MALYNSKHFLFKVFPKREIDEALHNPCIIHYADKLKPWKYIGISKGEEWHKVYNELFEDIRLEFNRESFASKIKKEIKGIIGSVR